MNIGIDIDDTISNTFESATYYAEKYVTEILKREPVKDISKVKDHYYVRDMFGLTDEEDDRFWEEYYERIIENVEPKPSSVTPAGGLVLDAGCGEGYYAGHVVEAGYSVMGVDLSKFAVDAAAKTARRACMNRGQPAATLYAVGSVFELPVADGSFDTVINVFAPCAPAEYARVLRSGGHLVVAGAGERHLFGLKQLVYDDPYLNDPRRDLPTGEEGLRLVETRSVTFSITVEDPEHMEALFSMTPYYWRTSRDGHARLAAAEALVTEVSFDLHVYEKI